MHTANEIADWFLGNLDREAGDAVTHLKLQKLVYYAQAWALALLDQPLFAEDLQAWAHGPVAPSVWRRFREHGWNALPPPDNAPSVAPEVQALLADVSAAYGEHSARALEELTHGEDPWLRARRGTAPEERSTAVIPKDYMRDYYRTLYAGLG